MKVYLQLLYLQALLLLVFGLLFFSLNQRSQKDIDLARHELQQREAATFDHILELSRSNLKTLAWDYSYWQDLIDWQKSQDIEWIKGQFEEVLYTYDADLFCVYSASGQRLIPTFAPDLSPITTAEQMPEQLSAEILTRPPELWFQPNFETTPRGRREIYYSPIQPQSDKDRSSEHFGYLVVARYWDAPFIASLESLTADNIQLAQQGSAQTVKMGASYIDFERNYSNYAGDTQITLKISKALPVSSKIITKQKTVRYWLFAAITLAGIALLSFIYYTISKPLKRLSTAIKTGDNTALTHLSNSKSEFRHLAKLISENQEQKQHLLEEIKTRKDIEHALIIAKTSAEQANQAKSQFLANMSHETRTPLHTISGFAALLQESELTEDQKKSLRHIRESADNLVKTLSDIIDLSSIEAEQMEVKYIEFEIEDLIDELVAACHSYSESNGLTVHSEISTDIPQIICTDYARLRRILFNIIENAAKFTDQGSITLRVQYPKEGSTRSLIFEIEDTGIGMNKAVLDHMFEAFYLGDDSDSKCHSGGGLGLPIAKGIGQLLGAEIEAESTEGKGTCIRVRLSGKTILPEQ